MTDEYRRDVDGLRAIAVLAVLGFHAFPSAVPGGFVGVDVFFVISGYLITGIIARGIASGTFSFGAFYARRIRRIFPALIVVLAGSLAIGWFVLLPASYANLGKHTLGAAGFVANFVVWNEVGYFDAQTIEKPLLHLWSLGVEEQFYVVWPALLVVLARLRAKLPIALAAIATGSLIASLLLDGADGFFLPVSRIWELALGGVLSFVPPRRSTWLSAIGLVAIAASIALFDGATPYPGWRALVPTIGAGLAILAGPGANRALGVRPLVAIGLVSYPLYLWHWVLLSFGYLAHRTELPFGSRVALLAAAGVLATLTYLVIERPLRRRRASLRQALALVLALIAVAAAGRLVMQRDGFTSRFPSVAAPLLDYRFDYLADAHAGECWLTRTDPVDGFASTCMPTTQPSLFVWGDSHAARLRPGIERVWGSRLAIGSATRDLCVPSLHVDNARCVDSNRAVLERLDRTPSTIVVLFGQWSREADDILELTGRLARRSRVIVLGPAPHWTVNLPAAVYAAWERRTFDEPPPRRLTSDLDPASFAIDRRMKTMAWPSGVTYVSAIDTLCNAEGCAAYVPGSDTELTAYDYGHLTTLGAAFVARALPVQ